MSSLLWHLSFHLIPRGSDGRIEIEVGAARTIGNAELTDCWRGRDARELAPLLDAALLRCESTAGVIERWGTEDDTLVELWHLPQGVSVYVRTHIITSHAESVERLMLAARKAELVIVLNDLRVVEPVATEIMAEIQNVSAARFLASPTQFLAELNGFA